MQVLTIPVKYVDTTKYKVKVYQDDLYQSWEDNTDMSQLVQFRDNDWTTYQNLEESGYVTENGKLTPATIAKLKAGKLFTIDYRRYSNADGGFIGTEAVKQYIEEVIGDAEYDAIGVSPGYSSGNEEYEINL